MDCGSARAGRPGDRLLTRFCPDAYHSCMTTRRVFGALLVLALLAGCTQATDSTTPEGTAIALEQEDQPVELQVTAAEKIADGSAVIIDVAGKPITLKSIELVTEEKPTVLGIHLVDLSNDTGERSTGITRGYPEPGAILEEIANAELRPEHRYQIMIGLQGPGKITGLRIKYEVDGAALEQVLPHQLELSVGAA
jgi:hypothetical protein